ncbi:MAG: PKD domain-containing protein [Bacteroidetes bacterium]|nr:PKD domain-containing protein [Bacteroidota bacterium]
MKKNLLTLLLAFILGNSLMAQNLIQMTLPSQGTTLSGNVRGYWFEAPTCFTITGVEVPMDASSGLQSIAILRLDSAPPIYSAVTNNFTVLFLTQNDTSAGIIPVNIKVGVGEYIGILGYRGVINSYGASPFQTNIGNFALTLNRMGMQFNLTTMAPQDLWSEPTNFNLSRVWMYYDTTYTITAAHQWQGGTNYSFSNGSTALATSIWDYGDGSPLDTAYNPTHTYASPGIYTVCSYLTGVCVSDTSCTTLTICPAPALAAYSYVTTYPTVDFTDASQNAASYSWDFGDGSPLDNTPNPSHTYSTFGTYQVCLTVTDTCGETHTDCKSISVCPALIPVSLGTDVSACGSAVLSPQFPNATYLWNTNATTAQITATLSGSYHVIVTDVNGCSGADTVDVVINPLPVVDLGPDLGQCGTSATLDAQNPGLSYLWSNSATTQTITVSNNGTYTVTVTDGFGCSNSDAIVVALLTIPPANLGNDFTMCQGVTAISTQAGAGYTYLWNTGSTVGSISINTGGTYWVVVTASNGCSASDTIVVTMNAPAVSYVETQTLLCVNSSPILLTPGTPTGGVYSGPGVTGNMFNPTTAGVGNKNVIYAVTDSAGCVGRDTSVIVVDPCSGVAELNEIGLQLYPNPSNGIFTIKFTKLVDEIIITDAIGKVIETIIPSGQQLEFDLSKKTSGSVFYKCYLCR